MMEKEVKPTGKPFKNFSFRKVLGGNFLTDDKARKNMPFLLFLAVLAFVYIGNSYFAEKNIRKIEKKQKELRELRYNYVDTKSELLQKSRASKVASSLAGRGLKQQLVPHKKIIVK